MKLTAFHVFGSFTFIPHVSPSDGGTWPVLVQGWTLNYEMFFYVLFAAVLFLPAARRFLALVLLFGVLVGFGLVVQPDGAVLRTYTSPLMADSSSARRSANCGWRTECRRPRWEFR